MKNNILVLGITALLALTTQANQGKLAGSIGQAHLETTRTSEQLKATLLALNALTTQAKGDLRPAYKTYCAEIEKTAQAAEVTRSRVAWMAGDGRGYFKDWQGTVDSISNESLRKKAQKRLNSVQQSYQKVEVLLQQAADKFNPFLSDLRDVEKTLATDITAGGVKAVRSTVKSANYNYQFIEKAINNALKEMQKMEKALSPEAGKST